MVHYSGNVQGVGFRFTTQHVAREFQVTGWVRNLPDGRVEMLAEGAPTELDRFQQAIERAMAGCIRDCQVSHESASGEFTSFRIAR